MKSDATIKDVAHLLAEPKSYLGGVLTHMRGCQLANGNAFLRVGASSKATGQYPCYRMVFYKAGSEKIFGSYMDSGRAFAEAFDKIVPDD